MFGWFHDFADPEIAGIEAVPGPSLGQWRPSWDGPWVRCAAADVTSGMATDGERLGTGMRSLAQGGHRALRLLDSGRRRYWLIRPMAVSQGSWPEGGGLA